MNKLFILVLVGLMVFPSLICSAAIYYGNSNQATLLQSSGLVRKWLVSNRTYLYSGEPSYWSVNLEKLGTGSIDAVKTENNGVIVTQSVGIYETIGLRKDMTALPLLLNNFIVFGIYGVNDGNVFLILLYNSTYGLINISITDNSTVKRKIVLDINAFTNLIVIKTTTTYAGVTNNVLKISDIYLTENDYDYYEIWDGPTLKYQQLINPDINDFITPPEILTNDTFYIFLICIGMILLGIIGLWIPLTALIGVLFGIVVILPQVSSVTDNLLRSVMIISLLATILLFAIGYKRR